MLFSGSASRIYIHNFQNPSWNKILVEYSVNVCSFKNSRDGHMKIFLPVTQLRRGTHDSLKMAAKQDGFLLLASLLFLCGPYAYGDLPAKCKLPAGKAKAYSITNW